jgi:hypothetical protein
MNVPPHPAKFSEPILRAIEAMASEHYIDLGSSRIIDPFAGVGGIYEVCPNATGVELLPRWAAAHRQTVVGNSRNLKLIFKRRTFGLAITSCCYGTRMADHHEAKDSCGHCMGCGHREWDFEVCEDDPDWAWIWYEPSSPPCSNCKGSGLSARNTYRHKHGEEGWVSEDNAGAMQWGDAYRELHEAVWRSLWDVLDDGGAFILNISDHIRKDRRVPVEKWHIDTLKEIGFVVVDKVRVKTKRNGQGANGKVRVATEGLYLLRKS